MGSANYEVACAGCGELARGPRQPRHQLVPCRNCARRVFVLPSSPLDRVAVAPGGPRPSALRRSAYRLPLAVGTLCVAAVVAGFSFALPLLRRAGDGAEAESKQADPASLKARIDAGRQALHQGSFRVALRELNAALALRDAQPDLMSPAEGRVVNQLQRQADLLARLSHLSLEEIVQRGKLARDAWDWEEQFTDFRGRGVIFDDAVRRDGHNRPVLGSYVVEVMDEPVRVALEELAGLRDLPLGEEPRMIFGARLRSCKREQGGAWVVRFEPDSLVLFTDGDAVETAFPVPPGAGLADVMKQQQRWLEEQVSVVPARP